MEVRGGIVDFFFEVKSVEVFDGFSLFMFLVPSYIR